VSAVGVKIITFQCFDKSQIFFGGFFSIISTIAVTLGAEIERNVDRFSGRFSAFIFTLEGDNITIKNANVR
jgi:hypothetical protein